MPPPARWASPTGPPDALRVEGIGRAVRPPRPRRVDAAGRAARLRHLGAVRPLPAVAAPTRPRPERARVARRRRPGDRQRSTLGTSVLTPTLRYHPSIIAQAFGTLGVLSPGRVFLGVGTGESLNETPATGAEWPTGKERRLRLTEAIELIRRLWSEERVDFDGEYYKTQHATIYDRPDTPVPIYVAASGPLAAKLAGTRRRRVHLHQRQGARAVRPAHRRRRGGCCRRRPRPGRRQAHDRDQGLLRHRRRRPRCATATGGRRWR